MVQVCIVDQVHYLTSYMLVPYVEKVHLPVSVFFWKRLVGVPEFRPYNIKYYLEV